MGTETEVHEMGIHCYSPGKAFLRQHIMGAKPKTKGEPREGRQYQPSGSSSNVKYEKEYAETCPRSTVQSTSESPTNTKGGAAKPNTKQICNVLLMETQEQECGIRGAH